MASTSGTTDTEKMTEAERHLQEFWPAVSREMVRVKHVEPGNQVLPLARIKKIMKLDEDVKMISAEAPLLFAKAAEIFIQELTLRAWVHTEDNKRRTLQRSDIAMAIAKYDMFDFLIDIVPRDEIKPARRDFDAAKAAASTSQDDTQNVQYYFQLAQQHQQALQQGTSAGTSGPSTSTATVVSSSSTIVPTNTTVPSIVQLQTSPGITHQIAVANPGQTAQIQTIQQPAPQIIGSATINPTQLIQGTPLQLVQQVLTPTGEITHIPIPLTQNQLNLIRANMQLGAVPVTGNTVTGQLTATNPGTGQPIIIQTAAPTIQTAHPTLIQTGQPTEVFLQQLQQHQQQQQQQQQHQQQHHPQLQQVQLQQHQLIQHHQQHPVQQQQHQQQQ
ncbi:nuclear transcription factor Y subunit gamma [Uranotaenia lowii]|uniref:nuclear transcription factor Y subunit gamma n=1 Tax=Uranotaenia lowii TaxID=190385 RepID=UPI00247A4C65|nr:nuclear transcription factor Y subunit gamma [Uranotaenia lowii]